ncbi:MAG: YdcF family protein [Bdellovibrio sp.]|nr:YdcF family protein [Bdellovibrio sp.]
MFVFISKIINLFISPFFLLTLSCLVPFLAIFKIEKRWLRIFLLGAPLWVMMLICSPLGPMLAHMIEKEIPLLTREQFEEAVKKTPDHPVAIVVLAGGVARYYTALQHFKFPPNFSRFSTPFFWGKSYPNVHFIVSCGLPDEPVGEYLNEGPSMQKFALEVGLDPVRIHVTRCTRNTFEEAQAAQEIIKTLGPQLIFVSSTAIHLPRAMGIYKKLGIALGPFPSQYYTIPTTDLYSFSKANIELLRQSLHELIGRVAYKLTGKL